MTVEPTRTDAWREPGETLLSVAEVAAFLGVPVATIYRWRHQRQGPVGYRIGRHVRYRARDIDQWLKAQRDTSETP